MVFAMIYGMYMLFAVLDVSASNRVIPDYCHPFVFTAISFIFPKPFLLGGKQTPLTFAPI
jgi:hypothetical protein